MGDWKKRLRDEGEKLVSKAKSTYDRITERATTVQEKGAELGRSIYNEADESLTSLMGATDRTYQRALGEDEREIVKSCPVALGILQHQEVLHTDPEIFGPLLSARMRPLIGAAVLGATGGEMLGSDEILSRITRYVFDGHILVGGGVQDRIADLIGPDVVTAVNRYMDQVPGSGMYGGMFHRIKHGHDLAAVAQVWQEHGTSGAVQSLYHIYGRDFFTPHGIPVLPAGSSEVFSFLKEHFGLKATQAADLISINFVELLGGIFTLMTIVRLLRFARAIREDAWIRKQTSRAVELANKEDFFTAKEVIDEVTSRRADDYQLTFVKAMINHRAGAAHEAHEAYVQTMRLMSRVEEPTVNLGGAAISFRGLAGIGALATSDALARSAEHQVSWLERVVGISRAGVGAFESAAQNLVDRRVIKRVGEVAVLPSRSLSAAINYYLAGQTAGIAMLLPERDSVLRRACKNFGDCLTPVERRAVSQDFGDDVRRLREGGNAQLQA